MELNERIKYYRQKAHLSQEKLAELMCVSRQAVTKWEAGQSIPTTDNLFRLAELFEISVDQLAADQESSLSVAEQVLRLLLAEEAEKNARFRAQVRSMLKNATGILLSFGLLFLLCKLLFHPSATGTTVLSWLLGTSPHGFSYVFDWLVQQGIYGFSSILCMVPVFLGRTRMGWMGFSGFTLGMLLGEICGKNPAGADWGMGHLGWLIWGCIFLVSLGLGWSLDRFSPEEINLKQRKFQIYLGKYILAVAVTVLVVRLIMPG